MHLKVSDLERSVGFYRDELGLELKTRYDREAAFLAAGNSHHHVGLNTWQSLGGRPPPQGSPGLERYTIALPSQEVAEEHTDPVGLQLRAVPAQ